MNHKLKALGLALFAVLAMVTIAASAASAANFNSEAVHTNLSGSQIGENKFTFNAGNVTCGEATFSGTQTNAKEELVGLTPSYKNCKAFGFVNQPIDVNNCEYRFDANANDVDIKCPAGSSMVITALNCWVTVGTQNGLKEVTYANEGAGNKRDIKIGFNLVGITYTQHAKTFPGCTNGVFNDGKYVGDATVKGTDKAGEQVGIWKE